MCMWTITQLDSLVRHSIQNANRAKALEPSDAFGENKESKRQLKQLSALKVDKLCICAFDFIHSVKVIKNSQSKIFNSKVLECISKYLKLEIITSNCTRRDWLQSQLASIYQNNIYVFLLWPSVFWYTNGRSSYLRWSAKGD